MTADPASAEIWLVDLVAAEAALAAWALSAGLSAASGIAPENGDAPLHLPAAARRTAHLALRLLLARWAGVEAARRPFVKGMGGKPMLGAGPPRFSLSHSGGRALIAISAEGEVGADIEAPRTPRMSDQRRKQIIDAAQRVMGSIGLAEDHDAGSDAALLQAWVQLEAIAKLSGEGMGRLLTRLGVIGGADDLGVGADAVWPMVRDLALDGGYRAAVAGGPDILAVPIRFFPVDREGIAALLENGPR